MEIYANCQCVMVKICTLPYFRVCHVCTKLVILYLQFLAIKLVACRAIFVASKKDFSTRRQYNSPWRDTSPVYSSQRPKIFIVSDRFSISNMFDISDLPLTNKISCL